MKRGQIVSTVGRGDFSRNPRPSLIIQSDTFNAHHPAVTVCPITSDSTGDVFYRVPLSRDTNNNLDHDSEVEIDLIQAIRRERIGHIIGVISETDLLAVERALRRWLDL